MLYKKKINLTKMTTDKAQCLWAFVFSRTASLPNQVFWNAKAVEEGAFGSKVTFESKATFTRPNCRGSCLQE